VAGAIGAYVMQRSNTAATTAPPPITLPAPQPEPVGKGEEEKRSLAKIAAERLAAEEKLAAEKRAAENAAADKAEVERIAAAKAQAERDAAEKAAAAKQKALAEKSKAKEPPAKPAPVIATPPPVATPEPVKVVAIAPEKPVLSPPAGEGPAFTYYLGFAHRGNGEAMLKVAESYESGRGVAQNHVWACGWYERAGRLGVAGAKARKDAVSSKLQPRELKQCQDWADGQSAPSG